MTAAPVQDETLHDRQRTTPTPPAPAIAQLFVVLSCSHALSGGSRHSLLNIDEVVIGRGAERSCDRISEDGVRRLVLRLPDARASSRHARLIRRGNAWELEDLGSRNGCRIDGQPVSVATLKDGAWIEIGHTFLRFRTGLPTQPNVAGDLDSTELKNTRPVFATLIPELAAGFDTLTRIAKSTVPVLLLGETGSGKELLARALHEESRRTGDLVAINCGAIPDSLMEAQLFGHVKGAFSGASRDEIGYVRAAHRGTLFLDEIGELPPSSQAALLRVLQENEVIPIGTTRPITVDIRVVAATHAPIDELVRSGSFRDDLFARLSGFRFVAPPLHERVEDLGLLISNLLTELSPAPGAEWTVEPSAARALFQHGWPHNIRELRQCLASAAVLGTERAIELSHLPATFADIRSTRPLSQAASNGTGSFGSNAPALRGGATFDRASSRPPSSYRPEPNDDQLRRELIALFTECSGNVSEVARRMGKARVQIQRWMKRFAIDPASFRDRGQEEH